MLFHACCLHSVYGNIRCWPKNKQIPQPSVRWSGEARRCNWRLSRVKPLPVKTSSLIYKLTFPLKPNSKIGAVGEFPGVKVKNIKCIQKGWTDPVSLLKQTGLDSEILYNPQTGPVHQLIESQTWAWMPVVPYLGSCWEIWSLKLSRCAAVAGEQRKHPHSAHVGRDQCSTNQTTTISDI